MSATSPSWPARGDWVWISRYAATTGLLRVRVARVMATGGIEVETGYRENHVRPGEYHATEAEAYRYAVGVVIREIAGHQREIDRLSGLAGEYARLAEDPESVTLTAEAAPC
jgi:hypothetical protein